MVVIMKSHLICSSLSLSFISIAAIINALNL